MGVSCTEGFVILKSQIIKFTQELLGSAIECSKDQGQTVCNNILSCLSTDATESELLILLSRLNQAYIRIEARGHLTSSEFLIVTELRKLEQSYE